MSNASANARQSPSLGLSSRIKSQDDENGQEFNGHVNLHVDEQRSSAANSDGAIDSERSREGTPPPLPPHQQQRDGTVGDTSGSLKVSKASHRPRLQSRPTTALSLKDIHTQIGGEISPRTPPSNSRSGSRNRSYSEAKRPSPLRRDDPDDTASIRSFRNVTTKSDLDFDVESLAGDLLPQHESYGNRNGLPFEIDEAIEYEDLDEITLRNKFENEFNYEFEELEELRSDASNEEELMIKWNSKLKHFLIFSAAGKPIYSRHGDDQLISNSIGVLQTIVSFFQDDNDSLKSFVAGDANFVVSSRDPLHLVAISRLGESDSQLRTQLDTLYMQILSTLTLPSMERMFRNRPSLDLRRPLGGTEKLLSTLADGFTRGSPTALLSSMECLRLQKAERDAINRTFIKTRSTDLLYGLVVAGGQLVSVLRPKKHSLHPSDLHLIFNMLFDADIIQSSGGERWIPICLPGFNNAGFLYMYVSFIDANDGDEDGSENISSATSESGDRIAILLLSANKEAFFDLRKMRDTFLAELRNNGSLSTIYAAVQRGRYSCADVAPGIVIRHFLYKSRSNVQFTMPSLDPDFSTPITRRRLFSLYASIHNAVHNRNSHLRVHYRTNRTYVALGWVGPAYEIYCVAGPNASRAALTQGTNRILQWILEEEEKLFIVGGAVRDMFLRKPNILQQQEHYFAQTLTSNVASQVF